MFRTIWDLVAGVLRHLPLAHNKWPIRLPVTVVAVRRFEDLGVVDRLARVMIESKLFWLDQFNVELAVTVRGLVGEVDPSADLGQKIHQKHQFEIASSLPTVYVLNDSSRLENKYLGLAWANGLAAVAGIVDEASLDEIIDHELGHLLGLDHEEGTFMAPMLELHNRRVTTRQRRTVRLKALSYHPLGGFDIL